jgi:phosphoribosylanthranilate isomerase
MTGTRVKICGITSADDARVAAEQGADYIGVIFAESPRQVDISRAKEIRAAVPDSMLVGVFRDEDIETVIATAQEVGLNLIQLHGSENPQYCEQLMDATNTSIIKTFHSDRIPDIDELQRYQRASFFLFDLNKTIAESPDRPAQLAEMWDEFSQTRRLGFRIFLAGALKIDNIRHALEQTSAYCVDVCRGVEKEPGIKDHATMKQFIHEVKR